MAVTRLDAFGSRVAPWGKGGGREGAAPSFIRQHLHTGLGAPRRVQAQPCPGCSLQGSRPSGDSDSRTTVSGTGKCTSRAVGFDSVESESDSQGQPCHQGGARLSLSFGHQMSYGLETMKPVPDRQQALRPAGTILTWLQALGTHRHSPSPTRPPGAHSYM